MNVKNTFLITKMRLGKCFLFSLDKIEKMSIGLY